jgi:DNA primase large subunit
MAVHRAPALAERELLGQYPFLPGAEALVEELSPSLGDLLEDRALERPRAIGRMRVEAALRDPTGAVEVEELDQADPSERFLSFAYARLLVSAAPSAAAVRRWAVAEAKRAWRRLDTAPAEELCEVARRMSYEIEPEGNEVRIRLTDYLHLATPIREADFHLVRQGVRGGQVLVSRKRAARLVQEGVRVTLTAPIALAPEVRTVLDRTEGEFLSEIARRVPVPTPDRAGLAGPLRPELFPPCIRKMRRTLEAGENLSHAGRFALAAFLHRAGAPAETIVDAYRGAPDFEESITRYQVEHITMRDGGRGYEPPECATLRTHGLCVREGDPTAPDTADRRQDPLCFEPWLRHPVQYYRTKGGRVTDRPREGAEEASGTPSGPSSPP